MDINVWKRELFASPQVSDDPLFLKYAGEQQCAPGHRYGSVRDHWLFHYVLGGAGRVHVNGVDHDLRAGDGFIFFPGQAHWYCADRDDPWRYAWVGFSGCLSAELLQQAGISRQAPVFHRPFSPELAACFAGAIEELTKAAGEAGVKSDEALRRILMSLGTL